jgi:transposase-like protein
MREQRSQEFWAGLIREIEDGTSVSEVARRHGVPLSTLHAWKGRIGKLKKPAAGVLVPVVMKSSVVSSARECELGCGETRLRFAVGTDVKYVAELARALGMQC